MGDGMVAFTEVEKATLGLTEKKLREAVKWLEWSQSDSRNVFCPYCAQSRKQGHTDGCHAGTALAFPPTQAEKQAEALLKVLAVGQGETVWKNMPDGTELVQVPIRWLEKMNRALQACRETGLE